jgi:hypothetical protein
MGFSTRTSMPASSSGAVSTCAVVNRNHGRVDAPRERAQVAHHFARIGGRPAPALDRHATAASPARVDCTTARMCRRQAPLPRLPPRGLLCHPPVPGLYPMIASPVRRRQRASLRDQQQRASGIHSQRGRAGSPSRNGAGARQARQQEIPAAGLSRAQGGR